MKVLVVGAGGREHALCWKLAQSPEVSEVWCSPGNAGIGRVARLSDAAARGVTALADLAEVEGIDLTVVGQEAYLEAGIADVFRRRGLAILGPTRRAAMLETSKTYAKEFMQRYGIPTARARTFTRSTDAVSFIDEMRAGTGNADLRVVVKADGLAAGKGVVVAEGVADAKRAVRWMMDERGLGAAGERVVVEEFLSGEEVTILCLTDGSTIAPLVPSQDHKRVGDGDTGPNTGGMGAYAPVPAVDRAVMETVGRNILLPTLEGIQREGLDYRGVVYVGLMLTSDGPRVLEFNARMGDPEAQVVMPLLDADFAAVAFETATGRLRPERVGSKADACACVVIASGGYPGRYETGKRITGLEEAEEVNGVVVFHAATRLEESPGPDSSAPTPVSGSSSRVVSSHAGSPAVTTAGGRVLGVTAVGADLPTAISRAYAAVAKIRFEGMHYRKDIGAKALRDRS